MASASKEYLENRFSKHYFNADLRRGNPQEETRRSDQPMPFISRRNDICIEAAETHLKPFEIAFVTCLRYFVRFCLPLVTSLFFFLFVLCKHLLRRKQLQEPFPKTIS